MQLIGSFIGVVKGSDRCVSATEGCTKSSVFAGALLCTQHTTDADGILPCTVTELRCCFPMAKLSHRCSDSPSLTCDAHLSISASVSVNLKSTTGVRASDFI